MNLLSDNKRIKLNCSVKNINNKIEFFNIINDIISNETVQKMKLYAQHCDTSCYEHCLKVAYYSYWLSKKMNLDYISTTRAAMLHDLFLYNWREKQTENIKFSELHAFAHPKIALSNASKIISLNKKEQDIILKHMWPVCLSFPKYRESYIVNLMDKYSAIRESFTYLRSKLNKNKFYRYAYVFLSLFILRIV